MGKGRLEAFSDGVIAIIITIMVLELKVPHGASFNDLLPLLPVLGSYVLSFIYVGIYWNNHHHMLHVVHEVSGGVLVGQPAPAVLAVADAVRHRLDGREPFPDRAGCRLRLRAADVRHRLHHPGAQPDRATTAKTPRWPTPSARTAKAGSRSRIYIAGIGLSLLQPWLGFALYICRRDHLADPRPPHRGPRAALTAGAVTRRGHPDMIMRTCAAAYPAAAFSQCP